MDLEASREIGENGVLARIYLMRWLRRSVDFIAGFINQVEDAKNAHLLHCFSRDLIMVDEVLKKIKYNDDDLRYLTYLST